MLVEGDSTRQGPYTMAMTWTGSDGSGSGSGSGTPSRARRLVTNNTRGREATAEPTSTLGSLLTGLFEYFPGNHDAEGARKSAHGRGTLSETLHPRSAMGRSGHADDVNASGRSAARPRSACPSAATAVRSP